MYQERKDTHGGRGTLERGSLLEIEILRRFIGVQLAVLGDRTTAEKTHHTPTVSQCHGSEEDNA